MTTVTIQGNTYSDDGTSSKDMNNGGHRTHFFPLVQDVVLTAADVVTSASAASDSEIAAAASETASATSAAGLTATSTSSVVVGTGSKSFTTQAGKQFVAGNYIIITRSGGADYMWGTITSYSGTALVINSQVDSGSGTYTDWNISISGARGSQGTSSGIPIQSKSAEYTAVAGDIANEFRVTGTWDFILTAAATLGNGWYCIISNDGSGEITVDPDGAEEIDGLTSFIMHPGEQRIIVCSGSLFYSHVLKAFDTLNFTTSATFTAPPGYSFFGGELWGGGGGGGKVATDSYGAGGGGGAYYKFKIPAVSFTFYIGGGGAGATVDGNAGITGGNSRIDAYDIWAYGGQGGNTSLFYGGGGGGSILDYANDSASSSHSGAAKYTHPGPIYGGQAGLDGNASAIPNTSAYGGGGGGSGIYTGGLSLYGGGGGDGGTSGSGTDGTVPGGGGGGTDTGTKGGDGAAGMMNLWGVI